MGAARSDALGQHLHLLKCAERKIVILEGPIFNQKLFPIWYGMSFAITGIARCNASQFYNPRMSVATNTSNARARIPIDSQARLFFTAF